MRLLLECGSDPNVLYDNDDSRRSSLSYDPMLILAAASRNVEVVELLLQHGADANVYAKVRYTLLNMHNLYLSVKFNLEW